MNEAFDKYFKKDMRIINESLKTIDIISFEKLIDDCERIIRSGHKIIASGLGKNVPICEKFVGTLLSFGIDANFLHTNTAVHGDIGMVRPGDLIILLTKSGSTTESVYLVEQLKKRENVDIWLLTFDKKGKLAKELNNVVSAELEAEGDLWNIAPNNSTIINLIVLQTLAIELSKRLDLSIDDFRPNHPGGAIGEFLNGK